MYKLLIEDDEGGKTAVSLIRDEITIGRKEGNTIRLTDRNVSRRHGRIVKEDERIFIEDVAARYGIKKNGKKIKERAALDDGDVVVIGDYKLTLQGEKKAKEKPDLPKPGKKPKARAPGPAADPAEPTSITDVSGEDFGRGGAESTQIIQTMPAKLVVISSNFAGEEFPLIDEEMVIGRSDACNIIIDHRSISGKHAKIVREDNTTYKIVDLKSKNGVRVSGETYRATLLQRGDVIELGHVKLRFVEPGENYVFTPKSSEEAIVPTPAASGGGGMDPTKIGGILALILAVVVVVGLVLFLGGDDDDPTGDPSAIAATDDTERAAALQEIEELETDGSESRVDVALDRAEEDILAGHVRQPATRLETIRDMMDPDADQEERIRSLERKIQHMEPFKPNYEDAVSAAESGEFVEALNKVEQIPRHVALRERLVEEGVMDTIFEGMIALARAELEDDNLEGARDLANEILLFESDHREAQALLATADDREEELLARAEREREAAAQRQASVRNPGTGGGGGDSAAPSLSAQEARELYVQAGREFAGGNPQQAIEICNRALRGGYSDCHRILGLSYGRLGDTASACRHFQSYLNTNPNNPGAVRSQMENYGCAP